MKIGVVSDTHGLLREEVLPALEGVQHILHAGDIGSADIIPALQEIAPTSAIRGNIDRSEWAEKFPEELQLELSGINIFMLHDLKALRSDPAREGIDIVISGHSHKPASEWRDGVLYLNPGSCGPRRFRLPVTLVTLEIGDAIVGEPVFHQLI
ncbi:metallophosphoesterase family protein [Nitratireductor basaltis]|uniref:Phosphoesterase n=1 Tax=Nitratireductor basaltis TaxID=472175 RepID=A0A084UEN3_9HYPH|nr:metallophosphoesterase family protein [Nitratireductor basaltis]KFB11419.1 Phosphoesterase, family [Nitratireductor basaltis]